ncbi:MAG TPA: sugar phosphate nucleotidyltransferase [Pirellulales bacterium]
MQAVLLAGGRGMRLRPYTATLPKPLVPLDDTPVVELLLRQLAHYGIHDLTVVLGHLAELIQAFLGDGSRFGVNIRYIKEETPLDTAGCLGLLETPREPFLVMNGDLLTNLDFSDLIASHLKTRTTATIATYPRRVKIDFGVLDVDAQNHLVNYTEKPSHDFLVSMGVYCFEPYVCGYVKAGEKISMPDLILRMKAAGETVSCYRADCYWLDIGRPDDYSQATDDFLANREFFLPTKPAKRAA